MLIVCLRLGLCDMRKFESVSYNSGGGGGGGKKTT
jgi:hypothetical protein